MLLDVFRISNLRGQVAAINRSQAVIEFRLDGTIITANDNFLRTLGYSLAEVRGQHHRMFVASADQASPEYAAFWDTLRRGQFHQGQYLRRAKNGAEVWIEATYNPILNWRGVPFKVVKYATDITAEKTRMADVDGKINAINKAQAAIEFELDGTIRTANENFLRTMGYTLDEIRGQHHRMFVDSAERSSAEYLAFWEQLRRGEYMTGRFKRVRRGGGEVWLQASYSPIVDPAGRVCRVVKYASDVTDQVRASLALDEAVRQTNELVQAAMNGDLSKRIPTAGKAGVVAALSQSVNALVESLDLAIRETNDVVQAAVAGDLTRRIPLDGKTAQIASMIQGTNLLIENMNSVVAQIKASAIEVRASARAIAQGNLHLSQRTESQAASVEETASSMEEMTSTVQHTADSGTQASRLASEAREKSEAGAHVVGSVIQAMGEINQSSNKIAAIIGVIDEIAFQTNLLALNAAVEAARAGDQGRGFAVVAAEVRTLAGRSASAAKEIKTLISDSVLKVREGGALVDQSGEALAQIGVAVQKVNEMVIEIAAACREQAAGIAQVNTAVADMDNTTQQNAALVEEAAAASQVISQRADELTELVERYRVHHDGSVAGHAAFAARAADRASPDGARRYVQSVA